MGSQCTCFIKDKSFRHAGTVEDPRLAFNYEEDREVSGGEGVGNEMGMAGREVALCDGSTKQEAQVDSCGTDEKSQFNSQCCLTSLADKKCRCSR